MHQSIKSKFCLLFILSDLEMGGAQKVILTIMRFLNRERFEVHLAIIRSGGALDDEIPSNVVVHDLRIRRVRYSPPLILKLCWSIKPDYIISTLGHLNLTLLLMRSFLPRKVKLIIREANTPSMRLQYTQNPFLYRMLYKILYPRAHLIFSNSHAMKADMIQNMGIPASKIVVTGNPVDIVKIREKSLVNRDPYARKGYQLVAVGRLTYQKGFDLLLKAVRHCLLKRSDWHLTIVGEGPERKSLEKIIHRLGLGRQVTLAGQQHNPYPFIANAHLLISSSRWEGLPNVVLESLACGTKVIAFDCPGGTREIIQDGENGWLIPSGDWKAMGEKIDWILGNLPQDTAGEKESFLPERYGCEAVVKIYESCFQ